MKQQGFTLVEIAIVLVVIGLLLGGVLKGQELVLNSRIRNAINEYNNVASAAFAYQDRYRQLPGDDSDAQARWSTSVTATSATAGNGIIEGIWDNDPGGTFQETNYFWQHLRNDHLVGGATAGTVSGEPPKNVFDGKTGVQDSVFAGDTDGGLTGLVVCQDNIESKPANIIDTRIDDGVGNDGSLRAGDAVASSDATLVKGTRYILCREL